MKQLGLNQSALAKRMDVSRPYITKVLRSDVNISFGTAAKLAKALEMDFIPELREKTGAKCHHSSDCAVQSDLRSVDMTPRAKLDMQGL